MGKPSLRTLLKKVQYQLNMGSKQPKMGYFEQISSSIVETNIDELGEANHLKLMVWGHQTESYACSRPSKCSSAGGHQLGLQPALTRCKYASGYQLPCGATQLHMPMATSYPAGQARGDCWFGFSSYACGRLVS